ncbi:DctP family TRAP transporter solute-binding subunit [Paraburkholderia sp. NMBU_R16]|uniref:TRAP transporter substrate-binding protein n=1 Tax=Paraburkholderia sp. NMBU_R16 TaxID=2698676 RepID=UPI001564CF25|nr:TRAP transporter substrate-binding protein [Paraburkholderia sp. NMBU_R16]NRO98626.1 DctP family TRAP transporter solute-binding subunit [Paraburkholderia sp. NMBU_R16]
MKPIDIVTCDTADGSEAASAALDNHGRARRAMMRAAAGTALGAALGPFATPHSHAQGAPKRLRVAHTAPTEHGWHVWSVAFKESLEKRSNGAMLVQIYPNAQMGTERDIGQAVRNGTLEVGVIGVGLTNWVPEVSITDAPYLWKSRDQAYRAFAGAFGDDLRASCREKGFGLIGWTDLGFRCITNSKRQIRSVNDMQGLKMRVPISKAYIAMVQAMGATTAAVDLSELYLALRQGVADGQETPPTVVKSNKYYEVQKYVAKTDHVLTTGYSVTSTKYFDGLSATEKQTFMAAASDADNVLRTHTQKEEVDAYQFLAKHGMQVNLNVDVESFRKVCVPLIDKMPDQFPPNLVKLGRATPI